MIEELKACLELQNEIGRKVLELKTRYKAVIEAERAAGNTGTICVEMDGVQYVLKRIDDGRELGQVLADARKLGGFWDYRLEKVGKVIR